jgi:hypothetical protein
MPYGHEVTSLDLLLHFERDIVKAVIRISERSDCPAMVPRRRDRPTDAGKPTILVGFAEALAAIETTWSLQSAGFRVVAFYRAGRKPALGRVRGIELHEVPRPEVDTDATVAAVQSLCRALTPAALLPLDDFALWVCSRLPIGVARVAGASGDAVHYALDKSLQITAAQKAGLSVPSTQLLTNLAQPDLPDFPVIIKPACALYHVNGALKRPTGVVCANSQEFRRALAMPWPGAVLMQRLVHGIGEGIFGHAHDGTVTGWSAHQRVRMVNPHGSASSACRSIPVDESLVKPCELFLQSIGWTGMFMLEFLRDRNGQPWFMELNGRAWGSMALARRRGFEYPAWTVCASLDSRFHPVPPAHPPQVVCRHLGLELVHLAFVARGPQSEAPVDWPSLNRAVRDVCRFVPGERLYNWNRTQPHVLLADLAGTMSQYARQFVGHHR